MDILLFNSLTRSKSALPNKPNIGMYVCGPTVYNRPHIGNARSVVVYDVLYRLLQHRYPTVTYVRNITDVDDKINIAAKAEAISIQQLTQRVTQQFHDDMSALHCLPPTIEPRATEHIDQIIQMIEALLEKGNAYISQKHVLFDVTAPSENPAWRYGMLSGRTTEEQQAGARIAVEDYKRNAGDFVLWKPTPADDDASSIFHSPWGAGRPGWHIECSAMATHYLGHDFDIHGGGADLKFPHHENEIAQSCCAHPHSQYAAHWVHNGFLTVNGEKMSKSLNNFITVHELLQRGIKGEVIRLALLSAHYSKPLDWNDKLITDCEKQLDKLYRRRDSAAQSAVMDEAFIAALHHDLNVPAALACLHAMPDEQLHHAGSFLGLLQDAAWKTPTATHNSELAIEIDAFIAERQRAKAEKNWTRADEIRAYLKAQNIELVDTPDGNTEWKMLG
jgi:cysteinyl-tRNA synthetase